MSYNVAVTGNFKKEAKKLAKKYASLKGELAELIEKLEENPTLGTSLGNNVYKIRISIASKGKGKSGGARVISLVRIVQETVYLVSIYDKSEQESISSKDIAEILKYEGIL